MKPNRSFAVLSLLLVIGCVTHGPTTIRHPQEVEAGILGGWTSVELFGSDMSGNIREIEYEFRGDGSFAVIARMSDKSVRSFDGNYKVLPLVLEMTILEKGSERLPYTLSEDMLTVKDPDLDSWVRLRRKGVAEQGTPADADKPPRRAAKSEISQLNPQKTALVF